MTWKVGQETREHTDQVEQNDPLIIRIKTKYLQDIDPTASWDIRVVSEITLEIKVTKLMLNSTLTRVELEI